MEIPKAIRISGEQFRKDYARQMVIHNAETMSDWQLSQIEHEIKHPRRCRDTEQERLARIFSLRSGAVRFTWMLAQVELSYDETPDEVGAVRNGYWAKQFEGERQLMDADYQAYKQELEQSMSKPKFRTIIHLGRYDAQDLRWAMLRWKKENRHLKEIELHFQTWGVRVFDPAIVEMKGIDPIQVLTAEQSTHGWAIRVCLETFTNGNSKVWGLLDNALHDVSLAIIDDKLRVRHDGFSGDNWTAYLDAKQWQMLGS